MSEAREKVKDFLRSNPGWHDAQSIAEALGTSKGSAMNLCECLRATRFVEKQTGLGRGRKNQYRWKSNDTYPLSIETECDVVVE
jgi:hypothetical protein